MPELIWSAWQVLAGAPRWKPGVLAETLDGGQAFRWRCDAAGVWTGVWADHVARLRLDGENVLEWSAPRGAEERVRAALRHYLSTDVDYAGLEDLLPWRSDAHLARCLEAFPGLRILRQPFGETLLCFLCSATKRITQIRQMVALLAEKHGQETAPGVNRLPAWAELAEIPEAGLRQCQLGFRAGFIAGTARYLAHRPGWLDEVEHLPLAQARARLVELPGVGAKVADCVLLFGAGRLEAFPVDTWIIRVMTERYGLAGWSPAQAAHFGRVHFGPLAGLAQQHLFAFERAEAKADREITSHAGSARSRSPRGRR